MAESSSTRNPGSAANIGAGLGSAIRILKRDQNRRIAKGLFRGAGAFFSAVSRILHLLFLEVTGFVFLCFATIGGFALMREYPGVVSGRVSQGRFGLTLLFTLMFAWFGLSSFWRARRKQ